MLSQLKVEAQFFQNSFRPIYPAKKSKNVSDLFFLKKHTDSFLACWCKAWIEAYSTITAAFLRKALPDLENKIVTENKNIEGYMRTILMLTAGNQILKDLKKHFLNLIQDAVLIHKILYLGRDFEDKVTMKIETSIAEYSVKAVVSTKYAVSFKNSSQIETNSDIKLNFLRKIR